MGSVKIVGAMLAGTVLLAGCAGADRPAGTNNSNAIADVASFKAKGEPRQCLPLRGTSLTPAENGQVMARMGANSWFRNELRTPCPGLNRNRTIVLRASTGQMCDMDVFEVVDPVSGMFFGVCSLGMFTPVEVPKGARW